MARQSGRGHIVTLATSKGGSGKSTAAAVLAVHSARQGKKVAILDADPQASLVFWHQLGRPPLDLTVRAEPSEKAGQTALDLAQSHDLVVVDTAGFRNRTTVDVLAVSDRVIIPIRPSPLDVAAAFETVKLVRDVEATIERQSRPLPYHILPCQIVANSVVARHVRDQVIQKGHPVLVSNLVARVLYAEAALMGRLPVHLEPNGPANLDGEKLAREIWHLLEKGA